MNPQEYQKRVKDLLEDEKNLKKAKEEFEAYKIQKKSELKSKEEELSQKSITKPENKELTPEPKPKENIGEKIEQSDDEEVIRLRIVLNSLIKENLKYKEELDRRERGIKNKENFLASLQ